MLIGFILNGAVSVSILLSALGGDKLVQLNKHNALLRALSDNATHAIVAGLTWLGVLYNENSNILINTRGFAEIFLCVSFASGIDVDHFISAHSIFLRDAITLPGRPFLHCTSFLLFLSSLLLLVAYVLNVNALERLSWIIVAAFFSHHIRDAARHGLWLWPFGSTPPFGTSLYLFFIVMLPYCLGYVSSHVHLTSKKYSSILTV